MSISLTDVSSGYNISTINSNFDTIETYINASLLHRAGNVAGQATMQRDLDMNGHAILNADITLSSITDSRALRVPISEGSIVALPIASLRANKLLSFDSNGLPVVSLPPTGSAADVLTQLASTESGKGDELVAVLQPAIGAVGRTQHSKNIDFISAEDFGAIADGTYHPLSERYASLALAQAVYPFVTALTQSIDYAAVQAAANAASSSVLGHPGVFHLTGHKDYVLTDAIVLSSAVSIEGRGIAVDGARLSAYASFTGVAVVVANASTRIRDVTFIGNTSTDGLRANKNLIAVIGCSFINCKDSISFHATDPVFYFSAIDCLFYTSYQSDIKTDNSSNGGVDMILSSCRFLDSKGDYCLNFTKGVGSIIADNLQISITGTNPTNQLVNWGIPAPGFGGCQFSNCVFEGQGGISASMLFGGASATPWKAMFFDNCFFTGMGNPAVAMAYVDGVIFTGCGFSSTGTPGIVVYNAGVVQKNTKFIGCSWDGTGSIPPIKALGTTTAQIAVVAPRWDGGASLVDFSLSSPANVSVRVDGGSSLATPVVMFPSGVVSNFHLDSDHPTYGYTNNRILSGTLTGTSMTFAHGVTNLHQRLLQAQAFYRGGSGELVAMNVTTVDGGNITFTGGISGRSFVVYITYSGKAWNTV